MSVYCFDTETTGKIDPEIIEAAWMRLPDVPTGVWEEQEVAYERFKPAGAISYGAMAVHHIVLSDLGDCRPSREFRLPFDTTYLVGHSIDFDWQAAKSPEDVKRICTYAMAKELWPDMDSFSQSALMYMLYGDDARLMLSRAHNARSDVINNERLLRQILSRRLELTSWDAVWTFSEYCRLPKFFTFGKHGPDGKMPGKTLRWVADNDPSYISWLLRQDWLDSYLRKALESL